MSHLGQRLRRARFAAGLSQEDIGDCLGVTRSAVSLWEKGRSMPTPDRISTLAEILKVTPEYLTLGAGKPPPKTRPPMDMMSRFGRLLATGKFDRLIHAQAEKMIMAGEFNEAVTRRIRELGLEQ